MKIIKSTNKWFNGATPNFRNLRTNHIQTQYMWKIIKIRIEISEVKTKNRKNQKP